MRRRSLTERDVRKAARDGTTVLDISNAVVTPSARDAARVLGVRLEAGGRPAPQAANAPSAERAAPAALGADRGRRAGGARIIALGADHGGVALKDAVATRLRELGYTTLDLGTVSGEPVDYPDFAVAVARAVAEGRATAGIMVDGAGIGSCMVSNKVRGVRAAMCHDVTTAQNAREHNDANVLTLGGGLIGTRLAFAIVETFLATPFGGGRHAGRVAKIDALDMQG